MAKIAKSVRVDPRVYEYIEKYKGNGFNEKFENIILDAMESEKKRQERLKQLDKNIRDQEEKFQKLFAEFRKLNDMSYKVSNIISSINDIEKKLKD